MTVDELKVIITAKTSGLRSELDKSKKELNTLSDTAKSVSNKISNAFKTIGITVGIAAITKAVSDGVKSAVSYEAALNQIGRTLGENTSAFMNWVENNAAGFGIAKSNAIKYGMTFSNMVSGFTNDTAATANITSQLLQQSAVIASATGRTIEDVMERIRSGMLGSTEAIEDLGVYTKVSAIEQTEAFKRMANGIPWSQLDYSMQQAITTMAILEQATEKYGNTMANTTSTQLLIFKAQLANLSLALGQAFLPIVNAVIPYLIQLVKWLQVAMAYVAAFINLLFGTSIGAQQLSNSMSGIVKPTQQASNNLASGAKSAKAIKNALMGFDEVNVLPESAAVDADGAGDVGNAGAIDFGNIDFTDSFTGQMKTFNEQVAEAQKTIEKALPWILGIGAALAALWIIGNLGGIATVFWNIGDALKGLPIIGQPLQGMFKGLSKWLDDIAVDLALAFGWGSKSALVVAISGIIAIIAIIALFVAAIVDLWKNDSEFRERVLETWQKIKDTLSNIWETILKPIFEAIVGAFLYIWEIGIKPLWENWKEFVKAFVFMALDMFDAILEVVNLVVDKFGPYIVAVFQAVAAVIAVVVSFALGVLGGFLSGISGIFTAAAQIFTGIIDFLIGVFTGDWERAWKGIKNIVFGIINGMASIVEGFVNAVIGGLNSLIRGANKLIEKIPSDIRTTIGIKTINEIDKFTLPKLPKLARGGIIDSPTLAMVGEAGKEAVMPLENNTGWIEQLASMLNGARPGGDRPVEVILQIGSTQLGRVVIDSINKLHAQEGRILLNV